MMGSPHFMDGKDGEKKMGKKWDLDGKILGLPYELQTTDESAIN